ncbi:MAG: pentapeptide repeat-containing protein [Tatlockia sp.]|nr:pentapeptide repeat-containing protein [Tatlockia sp.]
MAQFIKKIQRLSVIERTWKMNRTIVAKIYFLLLISMPVIAKPNYSTEDRDQFFQTNSCIKCDLTGVDFTYTRHKNAMLENARLMYSAFTHSKFDESNFVGAYFTKSEGYYAQFRNSNFTSAHLNYVHFYFNELSGSNFIKADLRNANFTGSNLSSVNFTNANVDGADFTKAILIGSNLSADQISKVKSLKCAILPNGEMSFPVQGQSCD